MYPFLGISSMNLLKKSCLQVCAKKCVAITADFSYSVTTLVSIKDMILPSQSLKIFHYIPLTLYKKKLVYKFSNVCSCLFRVHCSTETRERLLRRLSHWARKVLGLGVYWATTFTIGRG